jgi:two-component system cell cycle response regulator
MSGKVLVVDDLEPNLKFLEAKLNSEYYTVLTAKSALEGIKIAKEKSPDLILLDVMMPVMDGFEACKILKEDPQTMGIPVVMVTALTEQEDRVKGLQAGADDFITKPIDEFHLFARVRSLIRIKELFDELALRNKTVSNMGLFSGDKTGKQTKSNVLIINDDVFEVKRIREALEKYGHNVIPFDLSRPLEEVLNYNPDLVIISTMLDNNQNGLRIAVNIKTIQKRLPVVIIVDEDNKDLMLKGLQVGLDDYIISPIDNNELLARSNTILKRKLIQDSLITNLEDSVNASIIDQLTKLYNRRYLETHLKTIFDDSIAKHNGLVLLTIDIDNFKSINDKPGWGHHIGDEVLKEVAARIKNSVRDSDLAVRQGGEEFIILLPNTNHETGKIVAERIRKSIADEAVKISAAPNFVNVTVSIGYAAMHQTGDSPSELIKRSDEMLYTAKKTGKNKVVSAD